MVARGLARLSAAYAPLTVELFCAGFLGVLLRVAQRWVAAQLHADAKLDVATFADDLAVVFKEFGRAVPQVRARLFNPAAQWPEQSTALYWWRCIVKQGF